MKDSTDGYSAERLISLLEQLQDETEEKDRTIQALQRQCERKDGEIRLLREQKRKAETDAWKLSMVLERKTQELRSSEVDARSLRVQLRDLEEEVSELKSKRRFGIFR